MNLDQSFAQSELLSRIVALADRVSLGGGLGTSLNHLKRPGVNRAGEGLELWVKHFLAGTIGHADEQIIETVWAETFSFHGSANNPPDAMIRNSIASEVKKTENAAGTLQLNSSWPIRTLRSDDAHITQECRIAESWEEKPFLFIVGRVNPTSKSVSALWVIDGRCLSDNEEVYENLMTNARFAILTIGGDSTREIGKFSSVDSLGRTSLRVRPMFALVHPAKIFETIFREQKTNQFVLNVLIPTSSYSEFSTADRKEIESETRGISVSHLNIPDPTNASTGMLSTLISGGW